MVKEQSCRGARARGQRNNDLEALERANPMLSAFYLVAPFLFGIVYLGILYLALPWDYFRNMLLLMIAYLIPPAGKESVIPAGIALGLPIWVVVSSIALLDVLAGLFMALNFDLALKIPLLGRWIRDFIRCGRKFLSDRPWLERLYFVGLVLFVMFPLQGSGGIGGTIVGRMLGMSRLEVFAAIVVGAIVGCLAIALASAYISILFHENLKAGITLVAIIVFAILIVYARSRGCGLGR